MIDDNVLELDEAWSFVAKKAKNIGCGQLFVVAQTNLLLVLSMTVAKRLVANYGNLFHRARVTGENKYYFSVYQGA